MTIRKGGEKQEQDRRGSEAVLCIGWDGGHATRCWVKGSYTAVVALSHVDTRVKLADTRSDAWVNRCAQLRALRVELCRASIGSSCPVWPHCASCRSMDWRRAATATLFVKQHGCTFLAACACSNRLATASRVGQASILSSTLLES